MIAPRRKIQDDLGYVLHRLRWGGERTIPFSSTVVVGETKPELSWVRKKG